MTPEEEGKKNQEYYLNRQYNESGGTLPWHEFTRQPQPYLEVVTITPDMAKELLGCAGPHSRPANMAVVEAFKKDILDGKWQTHNQCIAVDGNSQLVDGLQRLSAVSASGLAVPAWMAFNCPLDADGEPILPKKKKQQYRSIDDPWEF